MCETCGCQQANKQLGAQHSHEHKESHSHSPEQGTGGRKVVQIEQDVLSLNAQYAHNNRQRLQQLLTLNLISSPGAGKTTLLVKTLSDLSGQLGLAVLEGDLQTDNDARRIGETGAPVYQINTGNSCHLDAHGVGHGLDHLDFSEGGVLFIENVGNLVCPTSFDLGEDHKVVLLSVTEGDDKPEKYPPAFQNASLVLLTKIDLLPYVDFDLDRCRTLVRALNPKAVVLSLSARTGEGMGEWYAWLKEQQASRQRAPRP